MLAVHVHVKVKPECIADFIRATCENAEQSLKEPGIARFDILQRQDDPARFTVLEVFRDEEAPLRHKETAHYLRWRDAVAGMMAEPRTGCRYHTVFPEETRWSVA